LAELIYRLSAILDDSRRKDGSPTAIDRPHVQTRLL
jgi:hypothetical protein